MHAVHVIISSMKCSVSSSDEMVRSRSELKYIVQQSTLVMKHCVEFLMLLFEQNDLRRRN